MSTNPLRTLTELGQSVWYDYIRRDLYEGPELRLFPKENLDRAEEVARTLIGHRRSQAAALGIDTAEGGDHTVLVAGNELGVLEVISLPTSDTNIICGLVIATAKRWEIPAEGWVFDRGGGGKQHADRLRAMGHRCRTVAFGEAILPVLKRAKTMYPDRLETREDKTVYVNKRAEMYGEASALLDPQLNPRGYGVPPQANVRPGRRSLREQLSLIPKEYDEEGRLKLRSKQRKPGQEEGRHKTLVELIGHSPDEADAFVLMIHGLLHEAPVAKAGAA